jgi:glycosyltransferase involved in cell wall biosynthesis
VPRVTVVMATYNWAPVLPWSIGSVLDQHFRDFELLVVGDGCTDESAEVVAAIDDPRVHWHNLPANSGHQSGPNAEGLRRAQGEIIAYLGHDDLWLPDHLATLVPVLDEHLSLVHGTTLRVSPGRPPAAFPPAGWHHGPDTWIPPTSVLHHRRLAEEVGGWRPPRLTGGRDPETELWQRLAERRPTRWVDRLTSVKLSATDRQDVYRDRPSFEQAWWLELIRTSPDAEAAVNEAAGQPYPFADVRAAHLHGRARVHWGLVSRWRRLRGRPPLDAEDRLAIRRHTKGLR